MKNTITYYKLFFPLTYGYLERWLEKMSESGAHLVNYGLLSYQFEIGAPSKRTYFVYQHNSYPRHNGERFNLSLLYPRLVQSIGRSKRYSKLNRNTHNKLSSNVIFEVDMPRAAQAYHDAVSDRNRLYRLEFFRNLGIGALLLAVLALSLFLKKEID